MKNRQGSYKKLLFSPSSLAAHGEYLRLNLEELIKLKLTAFEFTTLYIILFLRLKHPKNWLQPKSKSETNNERLILDYIPHTFALSPWEKEKLAGLSTLDLFTSHNLKAIPLAINKTMIHWITGQWKIEMLEHIPSPRELLELQVKNTRCMTVTTNPKKIDKLVLESRDPLSFVLHDLMHAEQFFSQADSLRGQLGFYRLIKTIYDQPDLKNMLKNSPDFKKEFEYVTSDMNAYVIHLFKCLKSAIMRVDLDNNFFNQILIWWNMSEAEIHSSHQLNTPYFSSNDEVILKKFFEKNQEILS